MYADRYAPKPLNRGSLTLSVSIVGGLVAAVMLSPTVIRVATGEAPLKTYWVPPAPPPPPVERIEPKVKTPISHTPIDVPTVLVPTHVDPVFVARPDPGPIIDPGPSEGTGGGVVIDPPKPPPPVLTTADIDGRYLRDFQPIYPTAERRAGNEGVVTVKVLIGVDGRVREVQRIAAATEEFWRVTERQALGKWRFKPATRDGIPIESWRTMTVRFKLEA